MTNRLAIYIEIKADSSAIIKTVSFKDSALNKKVSADYGRWRLIKDTIILNFEKTVENNNDGNQLKLLIKNQNILYSHRYENGKFAKDGLLWKAVKFVRLRHQFLYEYYNMQE